MRLGGIALGRSLALAAIGCVVLAGGPARARGANRIYWANYEGNTISYQELPSGGTGADLDTTGATMAFPMGMALDPAHGRVYWANWDFDAGTTIAFANLDGSGGGGTLPIDPTYVAGPHGLAIDPVAGKIYWPNFATNSIGVANLDGSAAGLLDTGTATVDGPRGVAIDPASRRIYWANYGGMGFGTTMSSASLDGGAGFDLTTTGATLEGPEGVALDPPNNKVYFGNYGPSGGTGTTLGFANLDGSGDAQDLDITGAVAARVHGVALDPMARRIYWVNSDGDTIYSASMDDHGDGQQVVIDPAVTPDFAVLPTLLYVPQGAGAPTISGEAATDSTLNCDQGSWAPDLISALLYRAPQSFSYEWTRDGVEVAGATSSSLTATTPGAYQCRVTAHNAAGSSSQTSTAFAVGNPPPPSNSFTIGKLTRHRGRGTATLAVTTPGPGELTLTSGKLKPQRLGTTGGRAKLTLYPRHRTAKLLRRRGHVWVTATIVFTPTGGNSKTVADSVKLVKKQRR